MKNFSPCSVSRDIFKKTDRTIILSDESRISMGNDCGQACDQPYTSTEGIIETTELTANETAIFTADQFGTVQNNSLNSHKNEKIVALAVKCMLCSL